MEQKGSQECKVEVILIPTKVKQILLEVRQVQNISVEVRQTQQRGHHHEEYIDSLTGADENSLTAENIDENIFPITLYLFIH